MNDREWTEFEEALRGLRDEALDEAVLDEVRASTLGRIRRDRRRPWIWGVAAAAVLMVATLGLSLRTERKEVPRTVVAERQTQEVLPVVAPLRRAEARRQPRRAAPQRVALAKEPMKIQMLTDDPDVVIIWLVGEEGDLE